MRFVINNTPPPPISIPEPGGATWVSAHRLWEAVADGSGFVDTVPNHYAFDPVSNTGTGRPTKSEVGTGHVAFDGILQFLKGVSKSEYEVLHDGTSDWSLAFCFKALSHYTLNASTPWGTGSSGRGLRLYTTGTSRVYGNAAGTDNSSMIFPMDDSWTTITLQFDASHSDLYKCVNGVYLSKDSNWQFNPEAGDHDIEGVSFGIHPSATSNKYRAEWKDFRMSLDLNNIATLGVVYDAWAVTNGHKI